MGADIANHQRIAIGRRARDHLRGNDAAPATLVVDNEGLAQHLGETVANGAGNQIDAAARRHGRDDLDGFRGPGLLGPGKPHGTRRTQDAQCARLHHQAPPIQHASPHSSVLAFSHLASPTGLRQPETWKPASRTARGESV